MENLKDSEPLGGGGVPRYRKPRSLSVCMEQSPLPHLLTHIGLGHEEAIILHSVKTLK